MSEFALDEMVAIWRQVEEPFARRTRHHEATARAKSWRKCLPRGTAFGPWRFGDRDIVKLPAFKVAPP
jgi:hypothetical protein